MVRLGQEHEQLVVGQGQVGLLLEVLLHALVQQAEVQRGGVLTSAFGPSTVSASQQIGGPGVASPAGGAATTAAALLAPAPRRT